MGREIRRVPPNWQHPRDDSGEYTPLFDKSYEEARDKWIEEFDLWRNGKHEEQIKYPDKSWVKGMDYWDYDSPPDRESYRPAFEQEPTWVQVYETVSEGTPVSPAFATEEELIEHLVSYGDDWSRCGGMSRQAAENFVKGGWAPSMIAIGGKVYQGAEGLVAMKEAGQ